MKQKVFNILTIFNVVVSIIMLISLLLKIFSPLEDKEIIEEESIIEESLSFLSKSPEEGLIEALEYYNVIHPNIVYAQAILETGHFKSRICQDYNNLFGLYNSKEQDYYRFNHWSESVLAYIDKIQYKYRNNNPSNDYYRFLLDIGYASDPEYINKLKGIINSNDKRRSKQLSLISD